MAMTKHYSLPITGMTCANCVYTVERNLNKVPGVESANVNLSNERASIDFDPQQADLDAMLALVRRAGYDVDRPCLRRIQARALLRSRAREPGLPLEHARRAPYPG